MARNESQTSALHESLVRLVDSPSSAAAAEELFRRADPINRELADAILADIPAFTESGNPDVLPELSRHAPEHTGEIAGLLRGEVIGDFQFVADHARRRAEQHFPLEATLHAYRCGHKVYSRHVREAFLAAGPVPEEVPHLVAAVADFTIEYTDTISTIATSAYVAQVRLLADVAGDQRTELLNILLNGFDESDGRVARILREAGYLDGRQSYCVLLARSVDPAEMVVPARARRMVDAIESELRGFSGRRVIDIRDNKVTAVFSDMRRASGWTAPRVALATRLADKLSLLGTAVLVGISNDVPSTSSVPSALKQAQIALEVSTVAHRIVQFSGISAPRLLLKLAGDDYLRVLPAWSDQLHELDAKSGGELILTLQGYADANMVALKAAKQLKIHPNTLYARLQRIQDTTGLDARNYHDLTQLLLVADCLSLSSSSRF